MTSLIKDVIRGSFLPGEECEEKKKEEEEEEEE